MSEDVNLDSIAFSKSSITLWNSLKTDQQRWRFLANVPHPFVVMLDNDETLVWLHDDIDEDFREEVQHTIKSFDGWIGDGPGIPDLLDAFSIKSDRV